MSSDRKTQSARANGAKSRGPITPEGRAKSSRNAVTHGLTADSIALSTESGPNFEQIRESYFARFDPQDQVELDLVDQMVAARWRLERIRAIETGLLQLKITEQEPGIERDHEQISYECRMALAFESLANYDKSLQLAGRQESHYQRSYSSALKTLLQLRAASKVQSEPNPTNEHRPEPGPPPAKPKSPLAIVSGFPPHNQAEPGAPAPVTPVTDRLPASDILSGRRESKT